MKVFYLIKKQPLQHSSGPRATKTIYNNFELKRTPVTSMIYTRLIPDTLKCIWDNKLILCHNQSLAMLENLCKEEEFQLPGPSQNGTEEYGILDFQI